MTIEIEYREGSSVSKEEQARILAEFEKKPENVTAKEFCDGYRIKVHTLNYWRRPPVGSTARAAKPAQPAAKPKEEDVDDVLRDVGDRLQAALTLAEGQETKLLEQLEIVREKIERTKETMRRIGFKPKSKEPESTLETEGD